MSASTCLGHAVVVALAAALGLPAAAFAIAAPTQFNPTDQQQVYTVPSGVMLEGVVTVGGWGGSTDPQPPASEGIFAEPATVQGYLATTPGETLYPEVGQSGTSGGGATFGGGGAAGTPPPGIPDCRLAGSDMSVPCSGPWAGSGGGASDVRTCSELAASCPGAGSSLDSRLIVAAGGGGEGGGGLTGNGAGCNDGGDKGGQGQNYQLPTASSSGPAAITTAAGIVIPGFAGGALASVTTVDGVTNAAMGTTAAGAGATETECSGNMVTYSNGVAGSAGSGADGGAGGNASGLGPCCGSPTFAPGGGGGGGGGYFGGGGGATGMGSCSGASCNGNGGPGQGGAAGSSFVSNSIQDSEIVQAYNTGDVFIEFIPVIEIDAPANGAVYTSGQVVDASWSCGYSYSTALGLSGCTATEPAGSAINTTPGTHTFTVTGQDGRRDSLSATVTYTVKASSSSGTPSVGHVTVSKATAHVPIICAGSGSCNFDLTLYATEKLRGGKLIAVTAGAKHGRTKTKVVVVGNSSRTLSAGQSVTVTVALNGTAKRWLKHHHRLKVKLKVVSGTSTVATRTLTFVKHKKHSHRR